MSFIVGPIGSILASIQKPAQPRNMGRRTAWRLCVTFLALLATHAAAIPLEAGTLYVGEYQAGDVLQIAPNGAKSLFIPSSGLSNHPEGLAVDGSGNVFVSDHISGHINEYTSAGAYLSTLPFTGVIPIGLRFDSAGNLFLANYGANSIEKFSPTGVDLGQFASLPLPVAVAFDASGNLYAITQNKVEKFSSTGTDLGTFVSGLNSPEDLAFDASGKLYVANYYTNSINIYSSTGTPLGSYTSGIAGPNSLAFDASGNLYVANYNDNTIPEFTPTGTFLGDFASNLSGPATLAFGADQSPSATPEPSSLALLGLGGIVLAGCHRLRSRKWDAA